MELSLEQKLTIREAQLQILSLREQSRSAQDQSLKAEQALRDLISNIAKSLNVNPDGFTFDLSTMMFVEKK